MHFYHGQFIIEEFFLATSFAMKFPVLGRFIFSKNQRSEGVKGNICN